MLVLFFEVDGISLKNLQKSFIFHLYNAYKLSRELPDSSAYEKYFDTNKKFVNFWNLSHSTILICPNKFVAKNPTHLLSFLQTSDYNHLLWKYVGKMLSNKPIYLNTHGLGISWLHVRLEWVPKYYHIH
jgi:hypothetical protein